MRSDSRLSGVLHVLLHIAEHRGPVTSEVLAKAMKTNPVVIRRIMAGLREQGYIRSEKGHGSGWMLACDLSKVTLLDIYAALGSPSVFAFLIGRSRRAVLSNRQSMRLSTKHSKMRRPCCCRGLAR